MKTMDVYREEVKKNLLNLPYKGHLLFGVSIAERLLPNYAMFQEFFQTGNTDILREGIALIRQSLVKDNLFDRHEIQDLIERIDLITPFPEDFPNIISSFALDACNAVYSSLHYMNDKNLDHIADVATYARDTVDMYIQEIENLSPNDPKIEDKIRSNKFMIAEKKFQMDLLKKLSIVRLDNLTDKFIEELTSKNIGIDLSLLPIE